MVPIPSPAPRMEEWRAPMRVSNSSEIPGNRHAADRSVMKLTGLTPNLITHDITRSTTFYRDVLGFKVVRTVPEEQGPYVFVWLERDGVPVFLNDAKTVAHEIDAPAVVVGKSGVSMFITMEGIDAYWSEVRDKARVAMPLKDQWYGMREFGVTDPDGYLITFAERIAQ